MANKDTGKELSVPFFDVPDVANQIVETKTLDPRLLTPDQRMAIVQYLRYVHLQDIAAIARALKVTRNIILGDLRIIHQESGNSLKPDTELQDELRGEILEKLQTLYQLAMKTKDPGAGLKSVEMLLKFYKELGLMGPVKSDATEAFDLSIIAETAASRRKASGAADDSPLDTGDPDAITGTE